MNKNNFYKALPEGYIAVKTIDAVKDKKFVVLLNLLSVVLMLAVGFVTYFFKALSAGNLFATVTEENLLEYDLYLLVMLLGMCLYMVLHELTHGLVYKIMTGEKLTFGLSLTCAYCGVPNIYTTRKTALLSMLAPFTLFSVLFIVLIVFLQGIPALLAIILFALHFGGCIGDLYDAFLLLFKYRGDILIHDNGPKQIFYSKQ